MNRILLTLKRPFIWLYRFRHRCGYGVHSPFAFNLITHVIYESTAYYKYEELAKAQKQLELEKDKRWKYESKKVKRLLFRLVNYAQPETIVDAVVAQQIQLVGLSALMTTTVVSMEETIRQLREKAPWCKVMVGGAVLNQEYADMIGADFYGKDAMQSVYYAQGLLQQ